MTPAQERMSGLTQQLHVQLPWSLTCAACMHSTRLKLLHDPNRNVKVELLLFTLQESVVDDSVKCSCHIQKCEDCIRRRLYVDDPIHSCLTALAKWLSRSKKINVRYADWRSGENPVTDYNVWFAFLTIRDCLWLYTERRPFTGQGKRLQTWDVCSYWFWDPTIEDTRQMMRKNHIKVSNEIFNVSEIDLQNSLFFDTRVLPRRDERQILDCSDMNQDTLSIVII